MNLTTQERQILVAECRRLAKSPNVDKNYLMYAEVFQLGYSAYYSEFSPELEQILAKNTQSNLPTRVDPEVSKAVQEEVMDILDMYRSIDDAIENLSLEDKIGLDLNKIEFMGFDGNTSHYHFFYFIYHKRSRYTERKFLNSHSSATIEIYRRMHQLFKAFPQKSLHECLTREQLTQMIDVV